MELNLFEHNLHFYNCQYMIPIDSHLLEKVVQLVRTMWLPSQNWQRTSTPIDTMHVNMFPCMGLDLLM